MSREHCQLPLPPLELLLVLGLRELLGEVEFAEQRAARVNLRGVTRARRSRPRHLGRGNARLQRTQQFLGYEELAIPAVHALDHEPRRQRGGRVTDGPLRDLAEPVVLLEVVLIDAGHPPAGVRVLLEFLDALALRALGEMEPELQDERPFLGQHALEADDLVDALVQRGPTHLALGERRIEDGLGVPGTEEDADPPLGRERAPEAPHARPLEFLVGWMAHPVDLDVSRVEPRGEGVHRLAPAAAFHAADEQQHRKGLLVLQGKLRIEQFGAQHWHARVVRILVYGMTQLGILEHGASRVPSNMARPAAVLNQRGRWRTGARSDIFAGCKRNRSASNTMW